MVSKKKTWLCTVTKSGPLFFSLLLHVGLLGILFLHCIDLPPHRLAYYGIELLKYGPSDKSPLAKQRTMASVALKTQSVSWKNNRPAGQMESSDVSGNNFRSGSGNDSDVILSDYFEVVRSIVNNELNGKSRQRPEGRGDLVIRITIDKRGPLEDVRLEKSSGISALDSYSLDAIRKIRSVPPIPNEVAGEKVVFRIPIHYKMI
jgi:TonB family protein